MVEELSNLWGKELEEEINETDVEDTIKKGTFCLVGKLLVERVGRERMTRSWEREKE